MDIWAFLNKRFLNAKNLKSVLLAEPHVAVMFSCRTLTRSAKVSCRTLKIAELKALNSEKDYLAEPQNAGSFRKCPGASVRNEKMSAKIYFFSPETVWCGKGLPCGGVKVNKLVPSLEAHRKTNFLVRIAREFRRDIPDPGCVRVSPGYSGPLGVFEKFVHEMFVLIFWIQFLGGV